jgi:diaminopimelate decarboxylase
VIVRGRLEETSNAGVTALARRFGTPAYLYELTEIDAAVADLRLALPEPTLLYYSLKANPHPMLACALREAGCHAEISSTGELAAALDAGFSGEQCLYTGPGKSRQEIEIAVAAGVRRFSVESSVDYRKVTDVAADELSIVDCLLRVNAQRTHGGSGLRMTGVASQFGVDVEELVAHPARFAPRPGGEVVGLHFFALSNARDLDTIAAETLANIEQAARLRRETALALRIVDLGGGFAAPYANPGARPDYSGLRPLIESYLDRQLPGWRAGDPVVAFESGRYLTGTCGQLVATVEDVKHSRDRTFVVLDTGINHLGGLSGTGRLLPMAAVPLSASGGGTARGEATVVGPLCTPADLLARNNATGTFDVGELVVIPNVGAYGLTASLIGFLGRPVAAEIVLRDGVPLDVSRLELRRTPIDRGE